MFPGIDSDLQRLPSRLTLTALAARRYAREVVEAMNDYLFHHNANTHWAYPTSEETDAIIDSARNVLADFLNASPGEIVFGANMTTLTFQLARALGRSYERDDEILVTELDHHANIAPWRSLEKEFGVKVRMVKMIPETGELDWNDFSRQLTERTKLVAVGAASNALGTINDVLHAGEMARSVGAKIFVDAVHYAPHQLIDVRAWNCDFLACSAYKFYGPHIGILYGRRDLLDSLISRNLYRRRIRHQKGPRPALKIMKESPAQPLRWIFSRRSFQVRRVAHDCRMRSVSYTAAAKH